MAEHLADTIERKQSAKYWYYQYWYYQYFAVHRDQSADWVCNSVLTEPRDVQLVKAFEKTFPRSEASPCNPVRDYGLQTIAHGEDGISDDELDLAAAEAVDAHYGA
jgi:hypothetical protein